MTGDVVRIHRARSGDGHSLTGDIRELEGFRSRILNRRRDILIYLPPAYESDRRVRYPVLYMHDGQNLFDGATSYVPGQEWGVDETAERLIHGGLIEPLIIVAVYNAQHERLFEYGPTRDERHHVGGGAALYGRMLIEEIKPIIDGHFRTQTGPRATGLGGSSMGGLVTLALGLDLAAHFGRLAVMSPAIWWDNRMILTRVSALAGRLPLRIWLDVGTAEGRETLLNARRLRAALEAKGWRRGRDLGYFEARGGDHSERAWGGRFGRALRFLFPRRRVAPRRSEPPAHARATRTL